MIDTLVADQAPQALGPAQPPADNAARRERRTGIRTIGFEYKGVWARTSLFNSGSTARQGWINVAEAFSDYVDCFVDTAGLPRVVFRLGDQRPLDARPLRFPGILIPVLVPPKATVQLRSLIRNNGATTANFQFWWPQDFERAERHTAFWRAVCYGALAFTIAVALVLALGNGSALSYLLVAEFLPVLLANMTGTGEAYQLLWPSHPELNMPTYGWILIGMATTSFVFRRVIRSVGYEDRLVKGVIGICLGAFAVAMSVPFVAPSISVGTQAIAMTFPLMLLGICVRRWHDNLVAKLIAWGIGVQAVALFINAAGVLGFYHGQFGFHGPDVVGRPSSCACAWITGSAPG